MKKSSNVFVDQSAWCAIIDPEHTWHGEARTYYATLLERGARLFTNNIVLDQTISYLNQNLNSSVAAEFLSIIDESVLNVSLRLDWISRRARRNAIENLFNANNTSLNLYHFYILETLKRKRIDFVFTFDPALQAFDYPLMPQKR
ncbi:MAG: hypothetical protein D6677_06140 [Calditrichaeota bacterium]|nr:MAG: hypothetical protein D6677_06140 [Calditrichota bacterium]